MYVFWTILFVHKHFIRRVRIDHNFHLYDRLPYHFRHGRRSLFDSSKRRLIGGLIYNNRLISTTIANSYRSNRLIDENGPRIIRASRGRPMGEKKMDKLSRKITRVSKKKTKKFQCSYSRKTDGARPRGVDGRRGPAAGRVASRLHCSAASRARVSGPEQSRTTWKAI